MAVDLFRHLLIGHSIVSKGFATVLTGDISLKKKNNFQFWCKNFSVVIIQQCGKGASVHYNCRERFYHGMQLATIEALKLMPGDPTYRFFYGVSLILEGRIEAAMRELHTVEDHPDVSLGSIFALMHAYKKETMTNHEALADLDMKLAQQTKFASEKAFYSAALFYVFISRYEKAKEFVEKAIKSSPHFREASVLRGWIELLTLKGKAAVDTLKYFESSNNSDPEAVFGRSKYFECKGNYVKALELMNQAVVLFPHYAPAFVEKAKLQLALHDWDQVLDTCNRALHVDKNNLQAHRIIILNLLCEKGDDSETHQKVGDFMQMLQEMEPKNASLFYETVQLFARVCGRNSNILQSTYTLIQEAANLEPSNVEFANEIGYQCLLQGKVREAGKFYRKAAKIDEGSMESLTGIIFCQILEGQLENAEQQLEFFKELQKSSGMTAEMLFLFALLTQKQSKNPEIPIQYLSQCVSEHFSKLEGDSTLLPYGVTYYRRLNPDFLLLVCKLCMNYVPDQPLTSGQPYPTALVKAHIVLTALTRACPGLLESTYLMAKLKYLTGDVPEAKTMLEHCLERDVTYADARLLLARIMFDEGNHHAASQALEVALSYNFQVRERPLFQLLMAKIQKKQGLIEDAIKTLQTGMNLAGLKSSGSNDKIREQLSVNDKASLYLELADCYRSLDEHPEAMKIMQDASMMFRGTPEEGRITIANADTELVKGDVDEAIHILRNVGPEQPYFLQAREKMAQIYLNYRKDKRLYAICYKEVVEKYPTTRSFIMLGDAYMRIQETEKAIEVYEEALRKSPRDSVLARKIGQALVKTHNFEKAVTYYKAAIKTGGQLALRYDLAELLFRMKRYQEAEDNISLAQETEKQANDLIWLQWESKFLLLLSKVYTKLQNEDKAISTLHKAWEVQTRVMRRIHLEDPDSFAEQRQIAIDICRQLAEHSAANKDFSPAIQFYKEALSFDDNNTEILLALAKLETAANNLDAARQYCQSILKTDSENDSATLMMADIMFRKTDLESAVFHFQHLLARKPDYYGALARFIEAVRRLGKLDEVPPYLQKAEEYSLRTSMDAGFNYCKGLYEWYTGNTSGAMKCFNKARSDTEWGQIATYHMIEICVNPDNEAFSSETFENTSDTALSERAHSQESAIRTAEKLLSELKTKVGPDLDMRIMGNFILLSKRNKADAEEALTDFLQVVSDERHKDHVGAILGIATAYMILKQTPRARNQLKKVANSTWNFCDAEYLERAWLLLADICIKSGKLDMASELLRNILQHNKSCTKAYDYMGHIMEKEQNHREASSFYELAWKQTNRTNPVIGYKLAFNYMKAKRYVDAIDVCHVVMNKYPNYPKIRKEILDKSRSSLRT